MSFSCQLESWCAYIAIATPVVEEVACSSRWDFQPPLLDFRAQLIRRHILSFLIRTSKTFEERQTFVAQFIFRCKCLILKISTTRWARTSKSISRWHRFVSQSRLLVLRRWTTWRSLLIYWCYILRNKMARIVLLGSSNRWLNLENWKIVQVRFFLSCMEGWLQRRRFGWCVTSA